MVDGGGEVVVGVRMPALVGRSAAATAAVCARATAATRARAAPAAVGATRRRRFVIRCAALTLVDVEHDDLDLRALQGDHRHRRAAERGTGEREREGGRKEGRRERGKVVEVQVFCVPR